MKGLFVLILVLFVSNPTLAADEVEAQSFWDTLRSKVEKVTPRKKVGVTTAVGGIRGSQSEDAGKLYWKGKEESLSVSEIELNQFSKALETAANGQNEEAVQLFQEFMVMFPQSELRKDSIAVLDRLKQTANADTVQGLDSEGTVPETD